MTEQSFVGTWNAKPLDWGLTTSKAGDPMVVVVFGLLGQGGQVRTKRTWYGTLKPEYAERTVDNLILMGLTGELSDLVDGPQRAAGPALSSEAVVQLVIETDEFNGKVTEKIKYINDPNRQPKWKTTDVTTVQTKLDGLKGLVASRKAAAGVQEKAPWE